MAKSDISSPTSSLWEPLYSALALGGGLRSRDHFVLACYEVPMSQGCDQKTTVETTPPATGQCMTALFLGSRRRVDTFQSSRTSHLQ